MVERTHGLSPGAAAEALAVSPQTLRRYAAQYERVFGSMERRNGQRLFTQEVLERLQAAQALVATGQAGGMQGALESIRRGPLPQVVLPSAASSPDPDLMRELAETRQEASAAHRSANSALEAAVAARDESAVARESVASVRGELASLRRELATLHEAAAAMSEELAATRADLDRLVGAMLELSGRQVESAEATGERLERLRHELLVALEATAGQDQRADAPDTLPVVRRRWWRFWGG